MAAESSPAGGALARRGARLALVLAWLGWGGWLLAQPAQLGSDDSLFFAHGLSHFSVLEFSPHFPGYPGLIALGRLILALTGDPVRALFLLSVGGAWLVPPALAWAAFQGGSKHPALVFAAALACPLLTGIGLALLSDSVGLLMLVLALGALAADRRGWAGLAAGACLTIRPSLAPLLLAVLVWGAWRDGRTRFLAGALGLPALGFGVILAWEGWDYVMEGLRFVAGHATLWGNTALSAVPHRGWLSAGDGLPGFWVAAVLAILALARGWRRPAGASLAVGLVWTLAMQNPEHLRHLAPLAMLAILAAGDGWRVAGLGLCHAAMAAATLVWSPAPPPLAAAAAWLEARPQPGLVITNVGVALLRDRLSRWQVADAHYDADSRFLAAQAVGPVYRLIAGPLAADTNTAAQFGARAPGEDLVSLIDQSSAPRRPMGRSR